MDREEFLQQSGRQSGCSRRQFLGGAVGAAAAAPFVGAAARLAADEPAEEKKSAGPKRKIKLGLVGCGGRGSWIAKLFQKHGGYEIHAVADYFQDAADRCGDALGVDQRRRFSGLSGYKKVIESGAEAVAVIVVPCFAVEHVSAAAEAGLHVYAAKPTAIDVPSCRRVEAAGKLATEKQRVFFVDYQMHTDPVIIQVAELFRQGGLGKAAKVVTVGINGGRRDPPKTATIESRLIKGIWDSDLELGGSQIVEYDIHALDAALWLLGQRPVAAMGASRICRPNPHGDSQDVCGVVYEYADGLIHEHSGLSMPTGAPDELSCTVYGQKGHAIVTYWGKARFEIRRRKTLSAEVVDLYQAGAVRNVASFYDDVCAGRCENPTVRRAVDGCLTGILGREAALRHGRLTMEELLKENRRLEVDLSGLKA